MALITCRDYTGVIEMAVFPKTYAKIKKDVSEDKVCVIKGKVASRNGDKTFIVDTITDLK
jgi:DNA polymerase III alpha subunit